jgi:hypothetical protein
MMTPDELLRALGKSGRPVSSRLLTDWRSKGLLPPLKQRGQGRGPGALYGWREPDILDRAATVYDLLALKSRVRPALMAIWFIGYPVEIRRIREAWVSGIREEERHLVRLAAQRGGLDNVYAPWATKLAKKLSTEARMKWKDLEQFYLEILGVIIDPDYEFDALVDTDLFVQVISAVTTTSLINKTNLGHLLTEIQTRVLPEARRDFLMSVSDVELLKAQSKWVILGRFLRLMLSDAPLQGFTGLGFNTAKRMAAAFGGFGILVFLHADRSSYSKLLDEIFELGDDLLASNRDQIHIDSKKQIFIVDGTAAQTKWELLVTKISDLWTLLLARI